MGIYDWIWPVVIFCGFCVMLVCLNKKSPITLKFLFSTSLLFLLIIYFYSLI